MDQYINKQFAEKIKATNSLDFRDKYDQNGDKILLFDASRIGDRITMIILFPGSKTGILLALVFDICDIKSFKSLNY